MIHKSNKKVYILFWLFYGKRGGGEVGKGDGYHRVSRGACSVKKGKGFVGGVGSGGGGNYPGNKPQRRYQ